MSAPRHEARPRLRAHGRSLSELVVGVSIAALVLTLAVRLPASIGHSTRVESLGRELLAALRFARGEAQARGVRVVVCASEWPQATEPSCAAPSGLPAGWLVFIDDFESPDNLPGVLDRPGDTLLRVVLGDPAVSVTAANPEAGNWLAYDPRGMLLGPNGWLATDIVFCLNGSASVVSLKTSGSATADQRRC